MFRSVIIGCGRRAVWHARAYRHLTRGHVVACCDRHADRREALAAQFGLRAYADAAEMIRQERPNVVHIVTLPTARVELMTLVSDLGVPGCLVEKPIAVETQDWRALVALEARSRTRFVVGAQSRYHPALLSCQEALRSGRLGPLLLLEGSARSTVSDQGVHNLDWAMSLNDDAPPVEVCGMVSGAEELAGRQPSPTTAVAQIRFANGVRLAWSLGAVAPHVLDDEARWKHGRIAAIGAEGRALYEEFARWEITSPTGVEAGGVANMEEWAASNDIAQANLTNALFDWLEDESKPAGTHLRRTLTQWNAILGLYLSTLTRQPVALPCDPPPDLWARLVRELSAVSQ
jgi:predicted dehydrogenase